MFHRSPSTQKRACLAMLLAASLIEGQVFGAPREQLVPILGVTTGQNQIGTVSYVRVSFDERQDQTGLMLDSRTTPGRFSRMAQTSIEQAIRRSARSLGVSTDSWTVELSVPYAGMTIYGDSVSAMVSLSVAAMAQGKTVSTGHVLTGTVTPDGGISPVGSVPLKVQAARAAKLRRVVISKHTSADENAGNLPVSIQVSPVQSVPEALDALTDSPPMKSTVIEVEQR
jgi:Lon protease-like protein